MDFEVLTNGKYKLLLEPIAYVVFQGVNVAMTATEAALYDQTVNGAMRAMLPTVGFQNLPLSMFFGDCRFRLSCLERTKVRCAFQSGNHHVPGSGNCAF